MLFVNCTRTRLIVETEVLRRRVYGDPVDDPKAPPSPIKGLLSFSWHYIVTAPTSEPEAIISARKSTLDKNAATIESEFVDLGTRGVSLRRRRQPSRTESSNAIKVPKAAIADTAVIEPDVSDIGQLNFRPIDAAVEVGGLATRHTFEVQPEPIEALRPHGRRRSHRRVASSPDY